MFAAAKTLGGIRGLTSRSPFIRGIGMQCQGVNTIAQLLRQAGIDRLVTLYLALADKAFSRNHHLKMALRARWY